MQAAVVRGVEVEIEGALDKLRAAAKELGRSVRELERKLQADATELKKYAPGEYVECAGCVMQAAAMVE
jgi:hypothetical protein